MPRGVPQPDARNGAPSFRSPNTELLQQIEWRAVLHVPARPGVSQVVPAKVLDTRTLERVVPSFRADLLDRLTSVGEHPARVLASLRLQHSHCLVVERHASVVSGIDRSRPTTGRSRPGAYFLQSGRSTHDQGMGFSMCAAVASWQ